MSTEGMEETRATATASETSMCPSQRRRRRRRLISSARCSRSGSTCSSTSRSSRATSSRSIMLLLVLAQAAFRVAAQPDSCGLIFQVYDSVQACRSNLPASAEDVLVADGNCNTMRNSFSAALPGTYRATCVDAEHVRVAESGCLDESCSSGAVSVSNPFGASGNDSCERDVAALSSFYSLLNPPELLVQDPATMGQVFRCFTIRSQDGRQSVTFTIFGDCQQCTQDLTGQGWPTQQPTSVPTVAPTPQPTPEPTSMPTQTPTDLPTGLRSTPRPTVPPVPATDSPTPQPTPAPTTEAPTPEPTNAPQEDVIIIGTTLAPAPSGGVFVTTQPTVDIGTRSTLVPLVLFMTTTPNTNTDQDILKGIASISWESSTATHIRNSMPASLQAQVTTNIHQQEWLTSSSSSSDTTTATSRTTGSGGRRQLESATSTLTITAVESLGITRIRRQNGRRQLQTNNSDGGTADTNDSTTSTANVLRIDFDAAIRYRPVDDAGHDEIGQYMLNSMDTQADRDLYLERLRATGEPFFASVETVQLVTPDQAEAMDITNSNSKASSNPNNRSIIAGGAAAAIAIIALVLGCCLWKQRKQKLKQNANASTAAAQPDKSSDDTPATLQQPQQQKPEIVHSEINLVENQDDISTLGGSVLLGVGIVNHNQVEDERTASIDGVNYDYNKTGNNHNMNNPGNNNNHHHNDEPSTDREPSMFSASLSSLGPLNMPPGTIDDNASFDQVFKETYDDDDDDDDEDRIINRWQRFQVQVPPGKLGMVVDTPNGGGPMVHAIKDDSVLVLRNQPPNLNTRSNNVDVKVGDLLVHVDQENVTRLSAVQVSSLIHSKCQNWRTLEFARLLPPSAGAEK